VSVLEVQDLRKVFVSGFLRKRTTAVDGVSFKVEAGEIFGFLGPNGAGKTTTMKMLMGLIHPTSGKALVFGRPAGDVSAKRRVGYLPENPYFYDYLTGLEFMHMVGRLYGLDRSTRTKRAHELLDRVGLSMAKARSMRSYSKGMMQRVGLAQALVGDPDVVVMDEPMSGLDPIARKQVRDLILELRNQGKTVFFCTHILADANSLCDRIGIIVKGKMRDVGDLDVLLGDAVRSVDVEWKGSDELAAKVAKLAGDHSQSHDARLAVCEREDAAREVLSAVLEGAGHILQVTPHRMTLEELFVRGAGERAEDRRS
jgi:ABC-2 type transport system ATP-binding protein